MRVTAPSGRLRVVNLRSHLAGPFDLTVEAGECVAAVDLAVASVLIVLDVVLSLVLRLCVHRHLAWAALRTVVQLVLIGFILRWV